MPTTETLLHVATSRDELLAALQRVAGAVDRRSTIPILSCVLLRSANGLLTVTASDLEMCAEVSIGASTLDPGALAVPAKRLTDYVSKLTSGAAVTMHAAANHWLTVTSGKSKVRIASISPESFPAGPESLPEAARVPMGLLKRMAKMVTFAISREASRFTLNGALLVVSPDYFEMVATDGHRLAKCRADHKTGATETRVLVPIAALRQFATMPDGEVTVFVGANDAALDMLGNRLTFRKLSGNFPNYERSLPRYEAGDMAVEVSTEALAGSLRRSLLTADERSHSIALGLGATVTVESSLLDAGESRDEIDAVANDAKPLQVGVNGGYVLDYLGACEAEQSLIRAKDSNSAIEFSPKDNTGLRYVVIVMPMRI